MKRSTRTVSAAVLFSIAAAVTLGTSGCNLVNPDDNSKENVTDTTKVEDTTHTILTDTIPSDSLAGTVNLIKTDKTFYLKGGVIAGDLTIGKKVSVVVLGMVNVTGSLTVKEGATLKFEEDAYLDISTGKLTVSGTDSLPVTLKNRVAGKFWGYGSTEDYSGGIWMQSNANPASSIRYAVIDSAKTGVYTLVDGISITNSTFKNNKFGGINFASGSVGPAQGFTDNSFSGNKTAPIRIYASQLTRLDGLQYFTSTEKPILVKGQAVTESGSWQPLSVPYMIDGIANVANSAGVVVTIEPGTNIIYKQGAYLEIGESGTVIVAGTSAKPVTMKPAETGKRWGYGSSKDYSGGIWVSPQASSNTSFKHLVLDSANTGIYVGISDVKIDSCSFAGNEHQAVFFANDIVPGSFSGNSFKNTGLYAFTLPVEGLGVLTNDCSYSGTGNQIRVLDGQFTTTGTVKNLPVPYLITGTLGVSNPDQEVVMTVEPGTHFKFLKGQWCELGNNGTLMAEGTVANPIVMENAVSGTTWGYGTAVDYCGGIWIESGATTNTKISYVTFRGVVNNVPYHIQNKLSTGNITNITVE